MADNRSEAERRAAEEAARVEQLISKPTFEQHVSADARKFEDRREEVREFCAERREAEIEKTVGGIDDPDMAEVVAEQTREVEEKWAKLEADRLEAIDREQQLYLERTRALYGRED